MRDYNLAYINKYSRVYLDDPDATIQFVKDGVLLTKDSIYFGSGAEMDLWSQIFEFIDLVETVYTLAEIERRLKVLDPTFVLNYEKSSITQLSMNELKYVLAFTVLGKETQLIRSVTR